MITKNIIAIILFIIAVTIVFYFYFVISSENFSKKQDSQLSLLFFLFTYVVNFAFWFFIIISIAGILLLISLILGWELVVLRYSIFTIFSAFILYIIAEILIYNQGIDKIKNNIANQKNKEKISVLNVNTCINMANITKAQLLFSNGEKFYMGNNLIAQFHNKSGQIYFHKIRDFEGKNDDNRDFIAEIRYKNNEIKFLSSNKYNQEQNKQDKEFIEKSFCEMMQNFKNCLTQENFELVQNYINKHKTTGNTNPEKNGLLRVNNLYAFAFNYKRNSIYFYKGWIDTQGSVYIDNNQVVSGFKEKVQPLKDIKIMEYEFCRLVNKIKNGGGTAQ